jgi:hypothetical protein
MKASPNMNVTATASKPGISRDEILMSLYATSQHIAALIANSSTDGTVTWIPMAFRNWLAKIEKPASPATPMNV